MWKVPSVIWNYIINCAVLWLPKWREASVQHPMAQYTAPFPKLGCKPYATGAIPGGCIHNHLTWISFLSQLWRCWVGCPSSDVATNGMGMKGLSPTSQALALEIHLGPHTQHAYLWISLSWVVSFTEPHVLVEMLCHQQAGKWSRLLAERENAMIHWATKILSQQARLDPGFARTFNQPTK